MARKESRSCELCTSEAKTFCESDQARLCWDCDEKVHAANFLVAKHTRTALCGICHSPTPWKASGLEVGRAISVCGACVGRSTRFGGRSAGDGGVSAAEVEEGDARSRNFRIGQREEIDDDEEYSDDDDSSDGDNDDLDGCDEDNDDDENQVVPTETSCSEEEEQLSAVGESASTSRFLHSPFSHHSNVEIGASSSGLSANGARSRPVAQEEGEEEILHDEFMKRPLKQRKVVTYPHHNNGDSDGSFDL